MNLDDIESLYREWDIVHRYADIMHKIATLDTARKELLNVYLDGLVADWREERDRYLDELTEGR